MKENKSPQVFMEFLKFGCVGLSNTAISYLIYVSLLGLNIHYIIASVVGFVVSVLNSFFWNNKYVFKKKEDEDRVWWVALYRTFMAYSFTGLVLTNICLVGLIEYFKIPKVLAPLIVLVITVPLNFVINKFWSFRTTKEVKDEKN